MKSRFVATFDNDKRTWTITEAEQRVIADNIPTAMWAEAMVEWMNSLELVPELYYHRRRTKLHDPEHEGDE